MRLSYKEKCCLSLLFALIYLAHPYAQPYAIGKTTITFTDGSRPNNPIETDIYYPASQAGTNNPVAGGLNIRFPLISFGHGFVMTVDAYANIVNMLVPEGYIVALPKTEGDFSPSHADFGKDLAFVIESMNQQNTLNSSLFFNKVDVMNCVMGHSMGGGAAHLAASGNPLIKSIATLAAAETNPSAITAASNISIPSLVIAASNDCVTRPASNQLPMYTATKSDCKTYISITGGSHCYMANNNFNCSFGESTCTPAPTISRTEQHNLIKKYLLPWLNYQLKNNCQEGKNFEIQMRSDTKISFQSNCSFCLTSDAADINTDKLFQLYPNPFHEKIIINKSSSLIKPVALEIKNMEGKTLYSQILKSNQSFIDTRQLQKGIYILYLYHNGERLIRKIIKAE